MQQPKNVSRALIGLMVVLALAVGALPSYDAQAAVRASPTAVATPASTEVARTAPPLSLTLMLLFTCCTLGLVGGLLVLGFVVSLGNRKAEKPDQPP